MITSPSLAVRLYSCNINIRFKFRSVGVFVDAEIFRGRPPLRPLLFEVPTKLLNSNAMRDSIRNLLTQICWVLIFTSRQNSLSNLIGHFKLFSSSWDIFCDILPVIFAIIINWILHRGRQVCLGMLPYPDVNFNNLFSSFAVPQACWMVDRMTLGLFVLSRKKIMI